MIVKNQRDIVIMCEPDEYRRLITKQKPLWTIFELAADFEDTKNFKEDIQCLWNQEPTHDEEDWRFFEKTDHRLKAKIRRKNQSTRVSRA